MSDPIDDILIDGETVLWRGQPDFARAKHRPKTWAQGRRQHACWIAGLFTATVLCFLAEFLGNPFIFGEIGIFLALLTAIVLWTFLALRSSRRPDAVADGLTYVVTNRRALEVGASDARASVLPGVAFVDLQPNGEVYDLTIHTSVDMLELCFQAIADGPVVEKLIIETLAPKQGPVS